MDSGKDHKTPFTRAEFKRIRQAIVDSQKKREYCIIDGSDIDNLEAMINHAFLDSFGIDLFDVGD